MHFYQQARHVLPPYAPLQVLGLALALVPLAQAARKHTAATRGKQQQQHNL
jgi:hypothetical protein